MSQKYDKLKTLLKELFQLNRPDLDFGLYRIMHAKSVEVTQFLDHDLLPQVEAAFAQYQSADKAEIQKELAKAIARAEDLGVDPAGTPRVIDLQKQIQEEAVDIGALETEVYERLFNFFRRYYSEGDFLSKRVYKSGVYAIPYEGEEVKLHWANADQYYTKTSEYLRDYAFRLRPGDEKHPMRVHFRLVDAAEGEHGNVKETTGKERRFALASEEPVLVNDGELVVRFTFQPTSEKQKDLNAKAERAILALTDTDLAPWIEELGRPHVRADGEVSEATRLRVHLDRYTARNSFDYFIHKDLGTFLRRELDFYIKNEVMHLDDIESESAPRVEQYLSKIKIIRMIAGKIIDFLAQLEDFQKRLWLKKKFVAQTSWCIRVRCIPESFYPEIATNKAQHAEWVELFSIDEIEGDLVSASYSKKLKPEFLKAHPTLVMDTRHFDDEFTAKLLNAVDNLDGMTDGVLFHSENFQALSLMQERYSEEIECVYIDPPYNTGGDGFAYKDNYQHSSWLSMLDGRVDATRSLMSGEGVMFCSIDDGEQALLRQILEGRFGASNFVANVIWQKKYAPANDAKWFSDDHDFLAAFARDRASWSPGRIPRTAAQDKAYSNPDEDPRGPWKAGDYKSNKTSDERPSLYYPITNPNTGHETLPKKNRVWAYSKEQHAKNVNTNRIWWGKDGTNKIPAYKRFLSEVDDLVPRTIWKYQDVGHNQDAVRQLRDVLPTSSFKSPKPVGLIERVARVANGEPILDYFAGSGTTGHAVINLNRDDGGRRKFVLVEMGQYFESVLLPRLKKVTFSPDWKNGKPKRLATAEEAERSPRIMKVVRLESYEDTLNNLEIRRTDEQQSLLDKPAASGSNGLKEQYLLHYMLDVETRGSQSLLNVEGFTDPTAYRLRIKQPGSDEARETNIDLIETFNWLIGLRVQHLAAPQTFEATFERDAEKRLTLKGKLKQTEGPFWFRTVTGKLPDGRRALVIWRKLTGNPEEDNLVLNEWFEQQRYSGESNEFDLVYVNGGNNLENLKNPKDRWKVQLIEEEFHRSMFKDSE